MDLESLLASDPFGERRDSVLLGELNGLTRHHRSGCPEYKRLLSSWSPARTLDTVPFLHIGLFKRLSLKTEGAGITHQRTLTSSSTSGSTPSQVHLDEKSSALQSRSVQAIHRAWLGREIRPLLILDDAKALRRRDVVSARLAAALSLQPLAAETQFILDDYSRPDSVRWEKVAEIIGRHPHIFVYGPTWSLWQSWATQTMPEAVQRALKAIRIDYVHSGGWKKLEEQKVDRERFDRELKAIAAPESRVVDYYGLSEQVGLLFPLCEKGRRHAPVWSEVLVRDIYTLNVVEGQPGFLQLLNPLAWGAPYHSILTEDLGRRLPGDCPCGRPGRHFELLGRVPKAEIRGCANV